MEWMLKKFVSNFGMSWIAVDSWLGIVYLEVQADPHFSELEMSWDAIFSPGIVDFVYVEVLKFC